MKNYQEKILKALEGGDLTSEELVKRTGLLIGQIRNALSELKSKGMIDIKHYKNKKAVWTVGENDKNRKTREIEEGAVFASEVMREAAKEAFLRRSYQ